MTRRLCLKPAKIAMVAYARLYNDQPAGPRKEFAQRRMARMAGYIAERWPDSAAAGEMGRVAEAADAASHPPLADAFADIQDIGAPVWRAQS